MQHVQPRTRAHVETRVFQIQTTSAAILAVREALLNPTRSVSMQDSLHEDARARVVR